MSAAVLLQEGRRAVRWVRAAQEEVTAADRHQDRVRDLQRVHPLPASVQDLDWGTQQGIIPLIIVPEGISITGHRDITRPEAPVLLREAPGDRKRRATAYLPSLQLSSSSF